jgi:hypothetical protein
MRPARTKAHAFIGYATDLTLLVTLVKWIRLNKQLECAVYGGGDAL